MNYEEFRALSEPCIAAGMLPDTDGGNLRSRFGGGFWGLPDEDPLEHMVPLLQVVVSELPFVPASLKGISVISVYISEELEFEASNGDPGFIVRVYRDGALLRPQAVGVVDNRPQGSLLSWEEKPDYPDLYHVREYIESDSDIGDQSELFSRYQCVLGTKIWGWPKAMQAPVADPRTDESYCLQVLLDLPLWSRGAGTLYVWGPEEDEGDEGWYCRWDA